MDFPLRTDNCMIYHQTIIPSIKQFRFYPTEKLILNKSTLYIDHYLGSLFYQRLRTERIFRKSTKVIKETLKNSHSNLHLHTGDAQRERVPSEPLLLI